MATLREVVLGAGDGTSQAIASGLAPGDAVVLEGIDRLREGRGVLVVKDPPAGPARK